VPRANVYIIIQSAPYYSGLITMDNQFKENVIKSFGLVKGDITAAQANLADISLAIGDLNKKQQKLVDEIHKLKISLVKQQQMHKELSKRVRSKSVVVRAIAKKR
jgi:predicted  nucleic acid-binding Zn-ribbon protein